VELATGGRVGIHFGIFTTNRHEPTRTRTSWISDKKFVWFAWFVVEFLSTNGTNEHGSTNDTNIYELKSKIG